MLKTYRIFREKAKPVTIRIDGRAFTPNFTQVGLFMDFSTRDKEIQDVIEKDIRFKSLYFLVYEEADDTLTEEEQDAEVVEADEIGSEDVDVEIENNEEEETTLIELQVEKKEPIICNAATSAEAKAFLRERGIIIANSVNTAKVIEVGKANGIEFPNLVINQ